MSGMITHDSPQCNTNLNRLPIVETVWKGPVILSCTGSNSKEPTPAAEISVFLRKSRFCWIFSTQASTPFCRALGLRVSIKNAKGVDSADDPRGCPARHTRFNHSTEQAMVLGRRSPRDPCCPCSFKNRYARTSCRYQRVCTHHGNDVERSSIPAPVRC